jgi:hypothetical protein
MPQQVERRKEGMGESIEVLMANGGEILKPDAAIMRLGERRSTIDRHLVAARRQADRQLFGKSLESAVAGWYAARAEEGDPHGEL